MVAIQTLNMQQQAAAIRAANRAAAEAHLAALKRELHDAMAERKKRMDEITADCRADRRDVREFLQQLSGRSTNDVRDQARAARESARLTRLTRLNEARLMTGAIVDRARATKRVEEQHQEEMARIDREASKRENEIQLAHERADVATLVRMRIFGRLGAFLVREARHVKRVLGESQAEAGLRHAERNPEKVHAALEPRAEEKIRAKEQAVVDATRVVRLHGGNVHVPPAPRPASTEASATKPPARPKPARTVATKPAPHPGGPPKAKTVLAPPPKSRLAAKKKSRSTHSKKKSPPVTSGGPLVSSTPPPEAKGPRMREPGSAPKPPKPPKRRESLLRRGGLLEDILQENKLKAEKKAARAKRPAKSATTPPKPSDSLPPALGARPESFTHAPAANAQGSVLSSKVEQVRPYKVRASCGHIVVRQMREATAGVPYTEDVVLDRPRGAACEACEAKKDYGKHAPRPAAEQAVKAPELNDTAEIAARVRADIKEAERTKALPHARYSVRTSKYSMGSSITVEASRLPFPVLNAAAFHLEGAFVAFNRDKFRSRYSAEADSVRAKLEAIVKAYHWDKSDLMADYFHSRFHYDIRLDEGQEFKRIEEALKGSGVARAGAAAAPSIAPPPSPPAPSPSFQLDVQTPTDSPKRSRNLRPIGTQQSLSLDAPLLHAGSAPTSRKTELQALEAMARPGGPLHGAQLEGLRPLLERVRTLTPAPGESRTQALWRYARAHPAEILALLETKTRSASTRAQAPGASEPAHGEPPAKGECEPRYCDGQIVESKWGERAEIEGWTRQGRSVVYRVVRGLERDEKIHDQWPAEVIVRTVPKGSEPSPSSPRAPNAYEQKKAARVERMEERAGKLRTEANQAFARERSIGSAIPFGQPILVGHHSERRHRRDIERMHALTTKGVQLSKQADALERRARSAASNKSISSDDPEAIDKLRKKADALAKDRERMRATNAVIRAGGADVVTKLVALGFSEKLAAELLQKDAMGRVGFPSYRLTNTAAEERRVRERLRELEARAAKGPAVSESIGDATIAEADNRVRITFPSKPSEAIRTALKGAGFRWAPSEGAWQRHASPAAWAEARRVLRSITTPSPTPLPSSTGGAQGVEP